jgi:hypothetical protein
MRELKRNSLAVDQFPALEADGYTKRTGLVQPAGFTCTVWLDGAVVAVPVTITEIGTSGEYRMTFTPVADGFMVVEVLVDFNKDLLRFSYQVVEVTTNEQVRKLDLAATVGPGAMTTGSLGDRLMNADTGKTYNQARDSLEGLRRLLNA